MHVILVEEKKIVLPASYATLQIHQTILVSQYWNQSKSNKNNFLAKI